MAVHCPLMYTWYFFTLEATFALQAFSKMIMAWCCLWQLPRSVHDCTPPYLPYTAQGGSSHSSVPHFLVHAVSWQPQSRIQQNFIAWEGSQPVAVVDIAFKFQLHL